MISRWTSSSAKEESMPANNRKNPFLLAPALALAVLVLLLVFGFLEGEGGAKTSALVLIFTLLAFGVPLLLFCFLRGAKFAELFPMRAPKKKDLLLALAGFLTLIFLTAAIKYALFGGEFDYREISLYGFVLSFPASVGEWLLAFFAVALLPAIMEELTFRGAVYYEYRMAGVLTSAVMSSLLASLLSFSFAVFPLVFVSSLFFSILRFLTGNLAIPMLMHIAYGIYTITFEKYIWLMSISSESRTLFGVLCVVFWGISLYLFLHLAEKILRERAKTEESAPVRAPKHKHVLALFDMLTAPTLWMLLCTYLIVAVVRLFV